MASKDVGPSAIQIRRARAFELSAEGYNSRQIAERLGVSHVTVRKDIRRHLADIDLPELDDWRKEYAERSRILTRALMAEVQSGSGVARAAEVLIKLDERTAAMLGADAAQRTEVEVTHTVAPAILAAIDRAQQNSTLHVSSTRTDDVLMLDSTHHTE